MMTSTMMMILCSMTTLICPIYSSTMGLTTKPGRKAKVIDKATMVLLLCLMDIQGRKKSLKPKWLSLIGMRLISLAKYAAPIN